MRDTEQYRQILGLERPWFVSRVELKLDDQRVDVFVEHDAGVSWACPQCDRALACRDHAEERAWRHLDTCQLKTYLRARVPRVDCPEHGVIQVRTAWAEARSRFTLMMERFVIDVLQRCATVQVPDGSCA
jgi:transposase